MKIVTAFVAGFLFCIFPSVVQARLEAKSTSLVDKLAFLLSKILHKGDSTDSSLVDDDYKKRTFLDVQEHHALDSSNLPSFGIEYLVWKYFFNRFN